MKQIIYMCGFFLVLIACSKDKFDYSECPTADNKTVSYRADIKPIIDVSCSYSPCHSAAPRDTSLVYDFTDYNGLKGAIGSVYNRIVRPVNDPLHMPVDAELKECDLAKLKIWIQNGAPEN
ncbi:MAG TPA: hypothetical protein VJY62_21195 [Bacteroidia bacterium]|nr:hypothetical protein [Bacteroidia bacterium]